MKHRKHIKLLRKGRSAWITGARWSDNPYGAPGEEPSRARSWSMGWMQMERRHQMQERERKMVERRGPDALTA
jgi:hypothetical protein